MSSNHFTDKELACHHCGKEGIQPDFLAVLEAIREDVGFAMPVTSGYRCDNHPIEDHKATNHGAHTQGRAVDVAVAREQAYLVIRSAVGHGVTGIGIEQKGDHHFLHLDMALGLPRPMVWSY